MTVSQAETKGIFLGLGAAVFYAAVVLSSVVLQEAVTPLEIARAMLALGSTIASERLT